ncbi:hypothetical protein [Aureibacter tunicatorum]|uniref:Outer membrane biogenesis lipoprotein LolB n=1 Tax=Aureibacter tunicatorum TaxID=866807 RepID=A0AAE3XPI8_9BACT|nr:hypothetical protein [Aureibacter tunicatorum]MDR6239581.1 outer membrane biogenesis lipoprotein LolB [Aureibacter tunicatorum]BDD04058.1 hypothetical protein AUTU_15410 [Aureibacter tunicatorum]
MKKIIYFLITVLTATAVLPACSSRPKHPAAKKKKKNYQTEWLDLPHARKQKKLKDKSIKKSFNKKD